MWWNVEISRIHHGKNQEEWLEKRKWNSDVGFPPVCYKYVLLPLVNKEAAFDQLLNRT